MSLFSIRDLSAFSQLREHTIRIWEHRFDFLKPERNGASHRQYSAEEVETLMRISYLNQSGFKVSQIASMSNPEKVETICRLATLQPHQSAIHELIISMAEMEITVFESIINDCVDKLGIIETVEMILLPFANRISMFHIHRSGNYLTNLSLISGLIRQKIQSAVDVMRSTNLSKESVLLCSPYYTGGNPHLDFIHYFLRKEGYQVIYPAMPLTIRQLAVICKKKNPARVLLQVHSMMDESTLNKNTSAIRDIFSQANIILLWDQPRNKDIQIIAKHVKSLEELMQELLAEGEDCLTLKAI